MKVLVTGATGYLGRKLIVYLAEQGCTVHAFARQPENAVNDIKNANIIWFRGDINNIETIEKALEGCDAVFHLAAFAGVSIKEDMYYQINVNGTKNVLEAALKQGIKRVVYTSTAGAMGPSVNGETVSENREHPGIFFNAYETSKYEAEKIAKSYILNGVEVVIVSPSRIFGPGLETEANVMYRLIYKMINGKWRWIPGDGKGIGNYTYICDVVEGHWLAFQKGKSGENYLLGGHNLSYNELFALIQKYAGLSNKLFKVPISLTILFSYFVYLNAKVTGKKPFITHHWTKRLLHNWNFSSEKAIKELGYKITPIEVGIEKTINDLLEKKNQASNNYGY